MSANLCVPANARSESEARDDELRKLMVDKPDVLDRIYMSPDKREAYRLVRKGSNTTHKLANALHIQRGSAYAYLHWFWQAGYCDRERTSGNKRWGSHVYYCRV